MKINRIKLIAYLGMLSLLVSMIVGLLGFSNNMRNINIVKNRLLRKHVENNIDLKMRYVKDTHGTLSSGDGTLLDKDGKSIEGSFEVVDSILEDVGDKSTIFVKVKDDFKRISTNIMCKTNERAVGTFLGKDHAAYETVMNGNLYVGDVEILGENYYAAYQPIKDTNENVIGLLFVGTPTEILDEIISVHDEEMNNIDMSIIVLRTISLGSLIALASISAMGAKSNNIETKRE